MPALNWSVFPFQINFSILSFHNKNRIISTSQVTYKLSIFLINDGTKLLKKHSNLNYSSYFQMSISVRLDTQRLKRSDWSCQKTSITLALLFTRIESNFLVPSIDFISHQSTLSLSYLSEHIKHKKYSRISSIKSLFATHTSAKTIFHHFIIWTHRFDCLHSKQNGSKI